jgi:zinc transporter ZupT
MILLVALGAFAFTLLGGLFALRFRDRQHLVVGFSAGALLGVVFFDLLPESIELAGGQFRPGDVMTATALGFLGYLVLDRVILLHGHEEEGFDAIAQRGRMGAAALTFHSFLDGVAIGFAFKASQGIGLVVTAAVLSHDFADGINTVSMIVKGGGSRRLALRWLLCDAVAPCVGVLATSWFTVPDSALAIILAVIAGAFLYIGAAHLLPEIHHAHPTKWTTVATGVGMAMIYLVVRLATG